MLQCYYMNMNGGCSYEQSLVLYEGLPKERQERISRLKNKEAARKQILAGTFLQRVLSDILDVPTDEIVYDYNSQGKPYLHDYQLFFNLSHSGDYAVLAVGDSDVGIDIERIRKNRISVAKRCFCNEEYEDIINAGDEMEQDIRFLEYWTMKEAYVKYIGKGLAIPMNSFRVIRNEPLCTVKRVLDENIENDNKYTDDDKDIIKVLKFEKDYRVAICMDNSYELKNLNFLFPFFVG